MSNVDLIIAERAASIGNFMVGRLLPFRQKRSIGPFVFIDHMGPVQMNARENFDVLPHPHIGLSTLTYLFEGSIMHRDSIGTEQEIKPGAVNWMTAGRGVVHSERTPDYLRDSSKHMHGLQIWVALPKDLEDIEPSFTHVDESQLPTWQDGHINFTLVAGALGNRKSGVPVYSSLYFIEIKASEDAQVNIGKDLFGEAGLYILEGMVVVDEHEYEPRQILVSLEAELCEFTMKAGTTVYIFGGEPFPEERFINWNFVSSDKAKIDKAITDWKNQEFPKIEGETEWVPYPKPRV